MARFGKRFLIARKGGGPPGLQRPKIVSEHCLDFPGHRGVARRPRAVRPLVRVPGQVASPLRPESLHPERRG